jgi:hypothetical protein
MGSRTHEHSACGRVVWAQVVGYVRAPLSARRRSAGAGADLSATFPQGARSPVNTRRAPAGSFGPSFGEPHVLGNQPVLDGTVGNPALGPRLQLPQLVLSQLS